MAFPPSSGFNFAAKSHIDTYPAITAAKCNHRGRAVFITGASRGIGRATAISFAQAGASAIAIASRSPLDSVEDAVIEASKAAGHPVPQVLKLGLDIADETGVAAAAAQIEQTFGRLDILINNAGFLENWVPIADSDPAAWWKAWEVNIKGTYLVTRALIPLLLKGGEKTMINVSSIGAHCVWRGASAYETSKLAMLRLTEFIQVDYAAEGLLAFSVHPGAIETKMGLSLPKEYHPVLVDTVELAADTMAWLTQERKTWLAGRYLSVNWDMEEIMSRKDEIVEGDKLKVKLVL